MIAVALLNDDLCFHNWYKSCIEIRTSIDHEDAMVQRSTRPIAAMGLSESQQPKPAVVMQQVQREFEKHVGVFNLYFEIPMQLLSIITKEFNEIRRQPRLIGSVILGPFLILLLFGMSFRGEQYALDTALVVPGGTIGGLRLEQLKQGNLSFRIFNVFTSEDEAMQLLAEGKVKVVAVLPGDYMQQLLAGAQATIEYRYNEVSPVNEQWIRYLGFSLVQELNRITVTEAIRSFKNGFSNADNVFDSIAYLDNDQTHFSAANRDAMHQSLYHLKGFVQAFAMSPLPIVWLNSQGNGKWSEQHFEHLANNLDWIDQSLSAGTFNAQAPRVRETYNQALELMQLAQRVNNLPPEVLAAPFKQEYSNVYGASPSVITFYAPSVFALIVQHIAVTLAALSIVRERLIGRSTCVPWRKLRTHSSKQSKRLAKPAQDRRQRLSSIVAVGAQTSA